MKYSIAEMNARADEHGTNAEVSRQCDAALVSVSGFPALPFSQDTLKSTTIDQRKTSCRLKVELGSP